MTSSEPSSLIVWSSSTSAVTYYKIFYITAGHQLYMLISHVMKKGILTLVRWRALRCSASWTIPCKEVMKMLNVVFKYLCFRNLSELSSDCGVLTVTLSLPQNWKKGLHSPSAIPCFSAQPSCPETASQKIHKYIFKTLLRNLCVFIFTVTTFYPNSR